MLQLSNGSQPSRRMFTILDDIDQLNTRLKQPPVGESPIDQYIEVLRNQNAAKHQAEVRNEGSSRMQRNEGNRIQRNEGSKVQNRNEGNKVQNRGDNLRYQNRVENKGDGMKQEGVNRFLRKARAYGESQERVIQPKVKEQKGRPTANIYAYKKRIDLRKEITLEEVSSPVCFDRDMLRYSFQGCELDLFGKQLSQRPKHTVLRH